MHLVYVDEVKYAPPRQPYHWLCALAFPERSVQFIDETLSAIAMKYFGTAVLNANNEFHGNEIVHGKGPYKGAPIAGRLALYKQLLDAIDETEGVGRIAIRIDPAKMVATKHENIAFMFLVEKVRDEKGAFTRAPNCGP